MVGLLVIAGGWRRLGTRFLLLRANIGINADVVVCELAHLRVVDTDDLGFFRSTEAEARDKVHNPEDDGSDDKGVTQTSARIGKLEADLLPVMVDPATSNGWAAVESSNFGLSKETG